MKFYKGKASLTLRFLKVHMKQYKKKNNRYDSKLLLCLFGY